MSAQTIGYKGHYIYISSLAGPERIEVRIGRIINKRLPWIN